MVDYYKDDGVSGGVPCAKRPEGARLLADAKAGKFDVLLIYRVDRLSRSLLDLLQTGQYLEDHGVTLRSMTEPFDTSNPLGKFVLQLLGMLAELEKSNIRDRSVTGSFRCAREGKWLGGQAPLGYKVENERLVVDPQEAALVHRIFTLCVEDRLSMRRIADILNAQGVPMRNELRGKGRQGKNWHVATIAKILNNKTYIGQNLYNKRKTVRRNGEIVGQQLTRADERVTRVTPPIIDPAIFARASQLLKENNDRPSNAKREYLLRGLIKCGICGASYSGVSPSGRNVFYYKCTNYMCSSLNREQRCKSAIVRGDLLEADVWRDIVGFAHNPGKVLKDLLAQVHAQQQALAPVQVKQDVIQKAIDAKQSERQRVIGLVRKALITDAEAEAELTQLQHEIAVLEERRGTLHEREERATELQARLADADAVLRRLAQAVEGATEETKRALMKLLVKGIRIDTTEESGKKKPSIDVIYAFESDPECISDVAHGSPLTTVTPASASPDEIRAAASRP